jgi:outer membrane protein TolC
VNLRIAFVVATLGFIAPAAAHANDETLTLTQALERGRERAFALRAARAQAASADANVDEQWAGYLPTLSASLTGVANTTRDTQVKPPPERGLFVFVNSSGAGTGTASLRWTLYDFGRTAGAVAAARANHRSAVDGLAGSELRVMSDVADAYVNLYYKERLRDVARATLEQRERRVALAKGLIETGILPRLEELRTTARADAARVALVTSEADATDARAALASLLGMDPLVAVHVAPPRLKEPDPDVAGAARAADGIPSVRGAMETARAKTSIADGAAAKYLPALSLASDGTYRYSRYDTNTEATNTRSVTGSLILSVPVLDFSLGPNLRGARADAVNAAETAREIRRAARDEATRAALEARATLEALEQASAAAKEAAAVLAIVEARYVEGLSSPLELIDAESEDSDARAAFTQSELAHALGLVRASVAIGTKIVEAP